MHELDPISLASVTGGADNVCTPDNPTGESKPQQFFENPGPKTQPVPNPRDTFFPGFTGRPPTAQDGERMADKIRNVGKGFGF